MSTLCLTKKVQEHVTEYGVHWNFFITLALLPVTQTFLHPVFQQVTISAVAVVLAVCEWSNCVPIVFTLNHPKCTKYFYLDFR